MGPTPVTSADDTAYERKMRLYGYLAEHERWQPLREIMVHVLGYLTPEVARAMGENDATLADGPREMASARKMLDRDIGDLESLGFQIERRDVVRPTTGDAITGYRLARSEYSSSRVALTEDETAILSVAAALARSAVHSPIGEDALAAIEKLMPGAGLGHDMPVSVSFKIPATERDAAKLTRRLHRLAEVLRKRHVLEFDYRKLDGVTSRRSIELYGLGERVGIWYAVGRDLADGAIKSFRVSRMVGRPAEKGGAAGPRYRIPADFDPADYILPPWRIGATETTVAVAFAPSVAHLATAMLGDVPAAALPDGRTRMRVPVRNVDGLVRWLMTFGDAAEVLAPADARTCATDMRARMEANRG